MPIENENIFYCNVDTISYPTKEQAKKYTGSISNRMKTNKKITKATAKELADVITKGVCFTTAVLQGTTQRDFVIQQLAVVDIDNEADIKKAGFISNEYKKRNKTKKTLDEAYKILEANNIEKTPIMTVEDTIKILEANSIDYSFIYYTFSHSIVLPKFRIVCVLSEPIKTPEEAKRLNQYMVSLFPQADNCIGLEHLYYGTNKGLATNVYDRTTKIIVPETFTPKEEDITNNKVSNPTPKQETKLQSMESEFNYTQAIRDFDLVGYVELETSIKGEQRGNRIVFNPCPLCTHDEDFNIYTDNKPQTYCCYSTHGDTQGNIINYLMDTLNYDKKTAREYFIYEIMGQDKEALKAAYIQAKKQENAENKTLDDKGKLKLPYYKFGSKPECPFYQIPKVIIDSPIFDNIDYGSKLLYALMLNRVNLSLTNKNFIDDKGNVYITYTVEQVMKSMRCSKPTARKMINQLDTIGLIEKRQQGLGKASILFVKDLSSTNTNTSKKSKKS